MTREMNKPDWCKSEILCGWWQSSIKGICEECPDYKPRERVLDEDWLVFVKELNKNLGVND